MKPDDRTRALNAAAVQLGWLADPDKPRARLALGVLADTDSRATIAAGSTDNEGRRQVGTHSDPTSAAAAAHLDVALDARRQSRALRSTIVDIAETARFLRSTVAGAMHHGPDALDAALIDVTWCLTIPHAISAWHGDEATTAELDHAVRHLHRQAELLAGQVAVVLRSAVRPPEPKPKQKPLDGCRSCARWGIATPAERYAHRCRRCGDFQTAHRCPPTEAICRTWDRLGDRARITPGMVAEAKAQGSRKTRRKRSA